MAKPFVTFSMSSSSPSLFRYPSTNSKSMVGFLSHSPKTNLGISFWEFKTSFSSSFPSLSLSTKHCRKLFQVRSVTAPSEATTGFDDMVSETKRKYYMLGGKGGVGKTSCAASLAVKFANNGHPTLVVSTDPAHSLSDSFAQDLTGGTLVPVEGPDSPLFALEINPEKAREEFRSTSQKTGGNGIKDFMDGMGLGMIVEQLEELKLGELLDTPWKMSGAVLVAVAAAIGNLLQGWDNATIAGAVLYIKKEFNLESEPTIEGLIVAMSLIGAALITTCSGGIADWLGRRPMLIISSVLYFVSSLVMLWSPNVYILLLARLLDGFGIGLAVTLVPIYIAEMAPTEIRGLLNTLPQFTGSSGMFLSYCMVFGMSLMNSPNWRLMFGVLSLPSFIYFVLTVFYLPESPRWLVSKGRMLEAKQVLQRLHGREDVTGELALLVEGLGVGGETSIEEFIMCPANELTDDQDPTAEKEKIRLYGPQQGVSWVARPVTGHSTLGFASRQGSIANQIVPLMDPLVTLFSSVLEKLPETGSMRSMLFPHFGSMFSISGQQPENEEWGEESIVREREEDYTSDAAAAADSDDNLQSPLISRQTTSLEKDMIQPAAHGTILSMRHDSRTQGNTGEPVNSMGIGGGWQLAWKWTEKESQERKKEGGFKRIYLHLVSLPGGDVPAGGEFIQAAALVSQPALFSKEFMSEHPVGPAMLHPAEKAAKGPSWSDLFKPGVKHALVVGVGIQILQQFSGINGVLNYTPQILEQAGVGVLLSNMGIGSTSASLLISAITTLLMLPCIAVAMRLMDVSGRRSLLLSTIPVLIATLVVLVIGSSVNMGAFANAAISTASVVVYFCCFVMGFGPIPNILCAEIFPTRVRGLCIAICALAFWIGDIIVTYSLPVMLNSIGLPGVFGMFAVVCIISWFFVFLKVPETKGMPLEVITEFFSVGAK